MRPAQDTWIGSLPPAGSIAAGACTTVSGPAYTGASSGLYFLGAIVDRQGYGSELMQLGAGSARGRGAPPQTGFGR